MSNSHQLNSYNYWVMDKTKGAEGNLHNKREAAESSFLWHIHGKRWPFPRRRANVGLQREECRRQVEQRESAASRRSKQGKLYLPSLKRKKTKKQK